MKEFDGDDQALVVLDTEDAAIQAGERAGVDMNGLAFAQESERAEAAAGVEDAFESLDFRNWDGFGAVAEANEADCAGDVDDLNRSGGGETAEEVAGEEGAVDGFEAIGPAPMVGIEGEEGFYAMGAQNAADGLFGVRFDAESEPFRGLDRHGNDR